MKKTGIILVGLIGLWSCDTTPTQTASGDAGFIAVETLIDQQITWLEAQNPEVSKSIEADQKQESRVMKIADWKKELEIFRQLDISKPGLQGLYTISSPSPDVRLYNRKSDEKTVVEWLKVQLDKSGKPLSLEGSIHQKNYLYESAKHLQMYLHPNNDKLQLTGYQIENHKKMLFSTPEHLVVKAIVQ